MTSRDQRFLLLRDRDRSVEMVIMLRARAWPAPPTSTTFWKWSLHRSISASGMLTTFHRLGSVAMSEAPVEGSSKLVASAASAIDNEHSEHKMESRVGAISGANLRCPVLSPSRRRSVHHTPHTHDGSR